MILAEQEQSANLISHLALRRALGFIGLLLPLSLVVFGLWLDGAVAPSISHSYYTQAGDLMVGALLVIAVFLWTYVGHEKKPGEKLSDKLVARVAGTAAALVALSPMKPYAANLRPTPIMHRLIGERAAEILHGVAAVTFFLAIAVFCLILFQRGTDPIKDRSRRIYRICGLVILGCILALLGLWTLRALGFGIELGIWVFVLESIGVLAFATAWLQKGETARTLIDWAKGEKAKSAAANPQPAQGESEEHRQRAS